MKDPLKQIHDLLVDQIDNISAAMDTNTDPAISKSLLLEMNEMTHRLNIVENIMFTGTSKTLEGYLAQINTANETLAKSIKGIQNIATFVNDATEFLKYVDQAIDLAKTLAI
jgi:uncharacterized protein YjgD (DUF1641 family)